MLWKVNWVNTVFSDKKSRTFRVVKKWGGILSKGPQLKAVGRVEGSGAIETLTDLQTWTLWLSLPYGHSISCDFNLVVQKIPVNSPTQKGLK